MNKEISTIDIIKKISINKDRLGAIFEHAELGKKSFFHPNLKRTEELKRFVVDYAYESENEKQYLGIQEANPLLGKMLKHANITLNIGDNEKNQGVKNDHSKHWVFDDKVIITGGINVGDEYYKWHDYMLKMESPLLVQKMKSRLHGNDDFDNGSSIEFVLNKVESGVVTEKEIEPKVIELIQSAKERITIEMAYFGDLDIANAIIEKANNGVPVEIILPSEANIQDDLNKEVMQKILDETNGNVSVYFFPRMLHAKLINVDHEKTFIGSANLNERAMESLGEFNLLINDKDCKFTEEVVNELRENIEISVKFIPPPKITFSKIKAFFERAI